MTKGKATMSKELNMTAARGYLNATTAWLVAHDESFKIIEKRWWRANQWRVWEKTMNLEKKSICDDETGTKPDFRRLAKMLTGAASCESTSQLYKLVARLELQRWFIEALGLKERKERREKGGSWGEWRGGE